MTRLKRFLSAALTGGSWLLASNASAEVVIGGSDDWEVHVNGRVGTFLTYAFGDALPVAPADNPATPENESLRRLVPGGGLSGGRIPEVDAQGNPIAGRQGTLERFRVRSGFMPNVFGAGASKQVHETLKLRTQLSIWGTIAPPGRQKVRLLKGDFREGYGQASGPWGALTFGRQLGLFSRGIVLMNFKYGHGYGVGYHGNLNNQGPTNGLIGFGVLAAFFQSGIMYSTPSLAGLKLDVGVYDAVQVTGAWDIARTPRPEFELMYDYESEDFNTHLFVNGAYQQLVNLAQEDETMYGAGYGGRFEFGPFHLGVGGHYGRGLGLYYALEGGNTSVGPSTVNPGQKPLELRTFDGFAAFAQYAPGDYDINLGFGQSRVHLLEADQNGPDAANNSVVKTQTGLSAAFVYHLSDCVHWDVDVMRAMFRWYKGESQDVNFVNTGFVVDW